MCVLPDGVSDGIYSGLTKTSTELPRLVLIFVKPLYSICRLKNEMDSKVKVWDCTLFRFVFTVRAGREKPLREEAAPVRAGFTKRRI
ncbi:hypothetical protein NEICINOT_03794 [Neisseria cinerea ATCC 14685]|uniref:Uncharacterized protein n=1 Tax=Neisseria cinerea ATCC 14685 TaxID=546262 RepID=D0W2B6_NEICI|nr:hypothetical protein NEICINOT_03794 [Neisseria cinerea ATCC 14685]